MMLGTLTTSAFVLGVLGATHCVTMCGGFAGLTQASRRVGTSETDRPMAANRLVRGKTSGTTSSTSLSIAQNLGRVTSYAMAGALAGAVGGAAGSAMARGQAVLEILSGALLLGVGLFLVGLLPAYASLERLGAPLFRALQPLARQLLPLRTPTQAALFGMAWGFLPCGLVYSALGLAALSGSALAGATTMIGFGLGTVPALAALAVLADAVADVARKPLVRKGAGVALVVFGLLHFTLAVQRLA